MLGTEADARLVTLYREGSEQAFEEIVRRYRAPLASYAASVATSARADDVVQEALVKAFRALPHSEVENLRAWLYTVVRNTALNDRASEARRPHDTLDVDTAGSED